MSATKRPRSPQGDNGSSANGVRVLKKYPNRRLYDTQSSSYITLADVKAMVLASDPFEVRDAKTGEDLTRSILLQIILEEESGGVPLFTSQMLAQIIRFYGHSMQGLMGAMIEKNLQAFAELQAQMVENSKGLLQGGTLPHELWGKALTGQAPLVQSLMSSYLEQSRALLAKFPGMAGLAGHEQPRK